MAILFFWFAGGGDDSRHQHRQIQSVGRSVLIDDMFKDLKVVVHEPLQILSLRPHGSREAVARFGIVGRWIGVVAVVRVGDIRRFYVWIRKRWFWRGKEGGGGRCKRVDGRDVVVDGMRRRECGDAVALEIRRWFRRV